MATLIVRHRVADFDAWKTVFDEMVPVRQSYGWVRHTVLRDIQDPSVVTIVHQVETVAGAKAYGASPELRNATTKSGVLTPPEMFLAEEIEQRDY